MDLVDLLRYLMRHRWIALFGLVLSAGGAAGAYLATPATYVASSQAMVLLPPTAGSTEETGPISPFLYQPGGLLILARIVTVVPNSPDFRAVMASDGYETSYSVELQTGTPIVTFYVEGASPESVLRTRDELMRRFQSELSRIQTEQKVPSRQFADVRILEASSSATPTSGDRLRSAALAGLAGVALTLAVIMLMNSRGPGPRRRPTKSPRDTQLQATQEQMHEEPQDEPRESAGPVTAKAPSRLARMARARRSLRQRRPSGERPRPSMFRRSRAG